MDGNLINIGIYIVAEIKASPYVHMKMQKVSTYLQNIIISQIFSLMHSYRKIAMYGILNSNGNKALCSDRRIEITKEKGVGDNKLWWKGIGILLVLDSGNIIKRHEMILLKTNIVLFFRNDTQSKTGYSQKEPLKLAARG